MHKNVTKIEQALQDHNRKTLMNISRYGGRVTVRTVYQRMHNRFLNSEEVEQTLSMLVRMGYGSWEEQYRLALGGRPTRYFVLSDKAKQEFKLK